MNDLSQPKIVCAAIRTMDGRIVCGPRHFDMTMWCQILDITPGAFEMLQNEGSIKPLPNSAKAWQAGEEGFIDQHGKFYTREEAWIIARKQQDLIDPNWSRGSLHSEHLY